MNNKCFNFIAFIISLALLCSCNNENTIKNNSLNENDLAFKADSVHMGADFCFIVDDKGNVFASGDNTFGQLGLGHTNRISKPQKIAFKNPIVLLEAGTTTSFAVDNINNLYIWGAKLSRDGINSDSPDIILSPSIIKFDKKIIQISYSAAHLLILTEDNEVYAYGLNINNSFGIEHEDSLDKPVRIDISEPITEIAAGGEHSLALTKNGEIYVWGSNLCGQLGNSDIEIANTVTKISLPYKVKHIKANETNSYLITVNGEVYSTGDNSYGQTGTGLTNQIVYNFTKIPFETKIDNVYPANFIFSSAVDLNGNLYMWGSNVNNTLGLGDEPIIGKPILKDFDFKICSASKGGKLLIDKNKNVYVWGTNVFNKLFVGEQQFISSPIQIENIE